MFKIHSRVANIGTKIKAAFLPSFLIRPNSAK